MNETLWSIPLPQLTQLLTAQHITAEYGKLLRTIPNTKNYIGARYLTKQLTEINLSIN